jgi:hypothetical protein
VGSWCIWLDGVDYQLPAGRGLAWQKGASNRALTLALACLLDANPAAGCATPCERLIEGEDPGSSMPPPHGMDA